MSFKELAPRWEAIPTAEATQRYDIAEASNDSVDVGCLFGDAPERFLVHQGDITIDGPLALGNSPGAEEDTVYVIDGDLTVNGSFRFENLDAYTPLYVTGTVVARNLLCGGDSCLFVGGSLKVRDLLMTGLTDAGHLVVHGDTSAAVWLERHDRGCVEFAGAPMTRRVRITGRHYDEEVEAGNAVDFLPRDLLDEDDEPDIRGVLRAALAGQPLLRSGDE